MGAAAMVDAFAGQAESQKERPAVGDHSGVTPRADSKESTLGQATVCGCILSSFVGIPQARRSV
jgi:hypothetical protein